MKTALADILTDITHRGFFENNTERSRHSYQLCYYLFSWGDEPPTKEQSKMSITQDILKAHNLKPHHAPRLVGIAKTVSTDGFIVGEGKGDATIRMLVRRGLLEYCEGIFKQDGWWFERARATAAGAAAGEAIRLDIIEQGAAGSDFHLFQWSKRQTAEQAFDLFKRGRL